MLRTVRATSPRTQEGSFGRSTWPNLGDGLKDFVNILDSISPLSPQNVNFFHTCSNIVQLLEQGMRRFAQEISSGGGGNDRQISLVI